MAAADEPVSARFAAGIASGLARTLVAHPFDSVKVWQQTGHPVSLRPHRLFRGIQIPLLTGAALGTAIVNGEIWLHHKTQNHALSGFITGALCTALTVPLDVLRIRAQTGSALQGMLALRTGSFGWGVSVAREAISGAVFFATLYRVKHETNSPLLAGAVAGVLSTVTHPIDVVKTRVQNGAPFLAAVARGGFHHGLPICLVRAVCVNAVQFFVYYCVVVEDEI
jgi:hypothetical protein